MSSKKLIQPLTDDEKFKLQQQSEHELCSLYREYTLLERDRDQNLGGAQLGRLNKILDVYKKEHFNIETDLGVVINSTNKKKDYKISEGLNELLENNELLSMDVQKQRKYLHEMDDEFKKIEKNVVKLRTQQTTDRQHEDRVWAAMKTVEGLENRLETQNKKFGTICAENRYMKEVMNGLLSERKLFLKIWNKLIDKLVLGKRFMLDLIEQATIAYDQREEWCSKLNALRLKAHYDLMFHVQEMRELQRNKENYAKLETFFVMKGQRRVMKDLQMMEKMKRIENKQKLKQQIEQFKKHVKDVFEFAQDSKVESIVQKYTNREANNFTLFTHINNLIQEMEFLNDQLGDMHIDIENQRAITSQRQNKQKYCLDDLNSELEKVKMEAEQAENGLKEVDDYLNKMCAGVDQIFKICQCDEDPLWNLLGNNNTTNIFNVFLFIELIEKKIHEVMLQVYTTEKTLLETRKITRGQRTIKSDKEKPPFYSLDEIVTSSPCPLCFETELVGDVIDSVQNVMTRKQIERELRDRLKTTDLAAQNIHNVSACFLPKSRQIVQKRYL